MFFFCIISVEYEVLYFLSKWKQADERKYESYDECGVELAVIYSLDCIEVESEHSANECGRITEVFYSEEHPSYYGKDESYEHTRYFTDFVIEVLESHSFEHEPYSVICAPYQEVPIGTVPES